MVHFGWSKPHTTVTTADTDVVAKPGNAFSPDFSNLTIVLYMINSDIFKYNILLYFSLYSNKINK